MTFLPKFYTVVDAEGNVYGTGWFQDRGENRLPSRRQGFINPKDTCRFEPRRYATKSAALQAVARIKPPYHAPLTIRQESRVSNP